MKWELGGDIYIYINKMCIYIYVEVICPKVCRIFLCNSVSAAASVAAKNKIPATCQDTKVKLFNRGP